MALYEALKLQVWRFPVQENNLNVNIFTVFVEKVFQEVAHTLVGYVAAHDNVSKTLLGSFRLVRCPFHLDVQLVVVVVVRVVFGFWKVGWAIT